MSKPSFEHRHYVLLASIIAELPGKPEFNTELRERIARHFAQELKGTNPRFSADRFMAAAMGTPSNGRDKAR